MANTRNDIISRIASQALQGGHNPEEAVEAARDYKGPKYEITGKFVAWECGCLARRYPKLKNTKRYDPIVFKGTPQQAVYDKTCDFHVAGMNKFLGLGHIKDLSTWKIARLKLITGEG